MLFYILFICIVLSLFFLSRVFPYDLFPNQKVADELGFEYVSLDELYAKSDIISLNW